MVRIVYKDLAPSELLSDFIQARLSPVIEKFPELETHSIHVTIGAENTIRHPGPDVFSVKVRIQGKRFQSLIIEKKATTVHVATAEICDRLVDLLNRHTDRARVRAIKKERETLKAS